MKTCVIVGATSMLGLALIDECLKEHCKVIAFCRRNSQRLSRIPETPDVEIVQCNLDELTDYDPGSREADVLFNFGWDGTRGKDRHNVSQQVRNIQYAVDSVSLASKFHCKKYFHAGSQAEYGSNGGCRLSNDSQCNPSTAYGIAKFTAGLMTRELCKQMGITHIWGRIFSVFGKNDDDSTLIKYAIDKFTKNEDAAFSSCTQMWDYIYEKDAAREIYLLGEKITDSDIFCIANGDSRPLKEYLMMIHEIVSSQSECHFSDAVGPSLIADVEHTFESTGYKSQYSFADAISEIIKG